MQNSNCIAGTTGDDGGDLGPFPTKKAKFCAAAAAAALCPVSCDLCKESCDDESTLPACVTGVEPTADHPDDTKKDKFCAAAGAEALCPVSCGTCKESCVDGSTLPACVTGVTQDANYPGEPGAKKAKFCVSNTLETCAVSCGSCPAV